MIYEPIGTPFSNLKNKTNKLKDWYSVEFVQLFCEQLNAKKKVIDSKLFLKNYKKSYLTLELKQRLHLLAQLLHDQMELDYKKKLLHFESILGDPWPYEEGMYNYGSYLYPISQFVENYGEEDIEASLAFIEKLTMRFTGEWAIRPLASKDPCRVLKQMKEWSKHDNFHVRRLASEGLRAKLPWGKKIDWINESPQKSLPIYNKLRNDKILYVRRSVANSMGDMIKINEDLAMKTFEQWLSKKKTAENLWVIKHAIRNPVKKKNEKFLALSEELKNQLKSL